jgi:ERF superfamily protein
MTETAIQPSRPAEIRPMDPMTMIQAAFQKALDEGGATALEVADRILQQMAKQRDYEDRDRFNASLLRIQKQLKPIAKTGWNDSTKSHFAEAASVDDAIEKLMQQEGMSLTFEPESHSQPMMVRIVGVLSQGAYSRRYPLDVPTDGQGPKGGGVMTRVHATGSAITYGKRYLKNMIFNLRFKEKDDDGNQAGGKQKLAELAEKDFVSLRDNISNASNKAELQKFYLAALSAAEAIGDAPSIKAFIAEKDKRYRSLA